METSIRDLLASSPLIASVQASPGSPLQQPEHLLPLAQASLANGVAILRLEGFEAIRLIGSVTSAPIIGLVKQSYPGSDVYITPTLREVNHLVKQGCTIIALDGTQRIRAGGDTLEQLIEAIHAAGRWAMADCDTIESARYAVRCGADVVGTTLAGYTSTSKHASGPDLEFLRQAVSELPVPVIAEGRYTEPWQVGAARRIGASAVVIGGSLNDPVKQTKQFSAAASFCEEPVLGVDLGGTWMRAGLFDANGVLVESQKEALGATRAARSEWIRKIAAASGVTRVGISSGGTIDPATTKVSEALPIIPDHVGTNFRELLHPLTVVAINDGHATAWGHACHPRFAGRRIATLALGTGVGFGLVDRGRLWMGPGGEYPRLNDLPIANGARAESLLGGAALSPNPDSSQQEDARGVARTLVDIVRSLYYPDEIVLAGGVGLSDWLGLDLPPSPYGADAGLYGAAALARYPLPW